MHTCIRGSPYSTDEATDDEYGNVGREGGHSTEYSIQRERDQQHEATTDYVGEPSPSIAAEEHPYEYDGAQDRILGICGTKLVISLQNGEHKCHRQHL